MTAKNADSRASNRSRRSVWFTSSACDLTDVTRNIEFAARLPPEPGRERRWITRDAHVHGALLRSLSGMKIVGAVGSRRSYLVSATTPTTSWAACCRFRRTARRGSTDCDAAAEIPRSERFVDDERGRIVRMHVARNELASCAHGNPHGLEAPAVTGAIVASMVSCSAPGARECDVHARPSAVNSAELAACTPGTLRSRSRTSNRASALLLWLGALDGLHRQQQHIGSREPRFTLDSRANDKDEQAADEQDDQSEGNLDGHERTHGARARDTSSTGLERPDRRERLTRDRWREAEQRRGEQREGAGYGGEPPVQTKIEIDRVVCRREHVDHAGAATAANTSPARMLRRRQGRSRSGLVESIDPAGPNRQAEGHLVLARGGRARNRFATFEPAMSRTSDAIDARIHNDRSNCRRNGMDRSRPLAAEEC
jgi:hypothetical protein